MRSDRPATEAPRKRTKKAPPAHEGEYFDGYSWKPIEQAPNVAAIATATAIADAALRL